MEKAPLSQVIDEEYNLDKALVIARVILDIHNRVEEQGVNFAQNYIYQKESSSLKPASLPFLPYNLTPFW